MKTLFPAALAALSLTMIACDPVGIRGKGDLVHETRELDDFHALSVSLSGEVEVVKGSEFRIDIQVEENIMPYLETEVRNGRLDVYFSRNVWDVDDLRITVTVPNLDAIDLSGSCEIVAKDSLSGENLDLRVSGSGDIEIRQLQFEKVSVHISGSGEIELTGIADDLEADVSGSGDLHAFDCPVKTADLSVSGSGNIQVTVSETLKADISGSGDVLYQGNPVLDVQTSGSGRVRKF